MRVNVSTSPPEQLWSWGLFILVGFRGLSGLVGFPAGVRTRTTIAAQSRRHTQPGQELEL